MTREVKIAKIKDKCYGFINCNGCPLEDCKSCYGEEADIDKNYELMFGKEEPKFDTIPFLVKPEVKHTEEDGEVTNSTHDPVNHPSHYTHGMEAIDEMVLIFGKEAVKNFCLCNAWKYRKRAIYKNGEEDMDKADWYINKYKELEYDKTTVEDNFTEINYI